MCRKCRQGCAGSTVALVGWRERLGYTHNYEHLKRYCTDRNTYLCEEGGISSKPHTAMSDDSYLYETVWIKVCSITIHNPIHTIIFFIYFNCACTIPNIPYTQQTEREPQCKAPACTNTLYLQALLRARTPWLLPIGEWGFHNCFHPCGGCVGKAMRTTVVTTHSRHTKLNPSACYMSHQVDIDHSSTPVLTTQYILISIEYYNISLVSSWHVCNVKLMAISW
jgi:hypothetical protein